jgi:hypothetical protein
LMPKFACCSLGEDESLIFSCSAANFVCHSPKYFMALQLQFLTI